MPKPKHIHYKAGYKYQLHETYREKIPIHSTADIKTRYLSLSKDGWLIIMAGYAWDGPSGPTIDTPSFMRGSLTHDALYQMMRMGLLDRKKWKEPADRLLQKTCIDDGMWKIRAWSVYKGLAIGAESATLAENQKEVLVAP